MLICRDLPKNKKGFQEQKPLKALVFHGADERIRTAGLLITNQLLYQLSYVGKKHSS